MGREGLETPDWVWSEYILQPHSQDGDKFGLSVLVCRLNEMMKSLSTVTDID